jgi:hypothetical protein
MNMPVSTADSLCTLVAFHGSDFSKIPILRFCWAT